MHGLLLSSSVRTAYADKRVDAYIRISPYGLSFRSSHLGHAYSLYALTPELLSHALNRAAGRHINIAISGTFVGSQTVTAGVDPREQVPPSYPLLRAAISVEVLPLSLRFALSGDGTTQPATKFELEFELPDDQLPKALNGRDIEQLASNILAAKKLVLSRKSTLDGAGAA